MVAGLATRHPTTLAATALSVARAHGVIAAGAARLGSVMQAGWERAGTWFAHLGCRQR